MMLRKEELVGWSIGEGMKIWDINLKNGEEIQKVVMKRDFFETYGSSFKRGNRGVSLYNLEGTGCVSVGMNGKHSIFDVSGVVRGKKSSLIGQFKLNQAGTIAFSQHQNLLATLSSSVEKGDERGNNLSQLEFHKLSNENKLGKMQKVKLIVNETYPIMKICHLELGEKTRTGQVIVGMNVHDTWNRENVGLFDIETGKEVSILEKCYHNTQSRTLHYDDNRQLLFSIGDRWFIDGGLKAWDFRTKKKVFEKELKKLRRTISLKIIGDDLWSGTVNNSEMYEMTIMRRDEKPKTNINTFDLRKLRIKKSFNGIHRDPIRSIIHFRDSETVCSCSRDGFLKFIDVKELRRIEKLDFQNEEFKECPSVCVSNGSKNNKVLWKIHLSDLKERVQFLQSNCCVLCEENSEIEKQKIMTIKVIKNEKVFHLPSFFFVCREIV